MVELADLFQTMRTMCLYFIFLIYSLAHMQVFTNKMEDDFLDQGMESSVLRIQGLEIALERAIEDIGILQKNLGFVIGVKQELECELRVREKREEALVKEFQRELAKRDSEIEDLKAQREEIAQLLADTQENLNARQAGTLQREEEKRRLQRIIQDQRSTLHALQEQLLATKYSADLSYQSITFDNIKIQEMEKENDMLRFELGKAKNTLEKENARVKRLEKEVEGFKSWLAGVMGVRKVVQGCQIVLMQQIQARLTNSPKY